MSLKLKAKAADLSAAISFVDRARESKTTIPVLNGVLLCAEEGDASVSVLATDLIVCAKTSVAAEVVSPGAACIPADKLSPIVRNVSGDITVEVAEENGRAVRVLLSWKGGKARLVCHEPSLFPKQPEMPDSFESLKGPELMGPLAKAALAASRDDSSHFTLNGVMLLLSEGQVSAVGCDGVRLSHASCPRSEKGGEFKAFVTLRAVPLLLSLEGDISVAESADALAFVSDSGVVWVKKTASKYPAWEKVIPSDTPTKVQIKCADFEASSRRLSTVVDEARRLVTLDVTAQGVVLSARSAESGEASDTIEAPVQGPGVKASFNVDFLLDFFSRAAGECTLGLTDQSCAGLLKAPGWSYVVMPLKESEKKDPEKK